MEVKEIKSLIEQFNKVNNSGSFKELDSKVADLQDILGKILEIIAKDNGITAIYSDYNAEIVVFNEDKD